MSNDEVCLHCYGEESEHQRCKRDWCPCECMFQTQHRKEKDKMETNEMLDKRDQRDFRLYEPTSKAVAYGLVMLAGGLTWLMAAYGVRILFG